MTFCDCVVCEAPIDDPADATLLRDGVPSETDPARVEYRHTGCDPADRPRDLSTTVEM